MLCSLSQSFKRIYLTLACLLKGKGTQGFILCLFKVASLATLNKHMLSSLATYDALSLENHKARFHLVWIHIVFICTALINGG